MIEFKRNKQVIIYTLFLIIMLLTIASKKNFHVDEMCSYILSNNVRSINMVFEEGYTYTPVEQVYLDNITVNDVSQAFNFVNVWKNQTNDVHPRFII